MKCFNKPFLIVVLSLLILGGAKAQGGFGAPLVKITSLNQQTGLLIGGLGAATYNKLYFGGGGMGLVNGETYTLSNGSNDLSDLSLGYGGLLFGYMDQWTPSLGFYTQGMIAWGTYSWNQSDGGSFFMIEPELGINIITGGSVNLGLGLGYRWAIPTNNGELNMNDLSGFSGTLAFKFGNLQTLNNE